MKKTLFAALLTCVLVSCAPNVTFTPQAAVTQIPATETLSPLPTFTPPPFIAFPTLPDLPPITVTPTQTPLPAILPKFPLDGYVMLFTKDGDLYFQDGNKLPVKLAHIEELSSSQFYSLSTIPNFSPYYTYGDYHYDYHGLPKISDDNQKIIFFQEDGAIYSINSDGRQKQTIIPSDWLATLEAGTSIGDLDFVPQTHIVFVKTLLCEKKETQSYFCSTTIFLIDADTGKMEKLADLGKATYFGWRALHNNIRFSPDGKMLAVGTKEGITIFALDGKVIRQNILPFASEFERFPSLFWLPDSSGFIAALPDALADVAMWDHTTAYTIWRYSLNDNSAVQISLDPPVIQYYFEVSPDGNWMVYYGGIYESPHDLYLGDLTNGNTKMLGNAGEQSNMSWSPDSKRFFATFGLGTLDGAFLREIPPALSWIDARHFAAFRGFGHKMQQALVGEIRSDGVFYYEAGFLYPPHRLLLMKPKQ